MNSRREGCLRPKRFRAKWLPVRVTKTRPMTMSRRRVAEAMRSIDQAGPPVPERIQWVEARGRAFSFTLAAGLPLLEAARRGFAEAGFSGGVLSMRGGALGPFAYVMPALSKTGANAAFYSDRFRPSGITRLKLGAMTLGERDGAPFFHCHGLWTETDGHLHGGHILPEESIVAESFEVEAFGIDGATFMAEPDPETNCKLFGTLEAEVDVALVDYVGGIAEGQLMRGDNPVLMTMELVLEVV